MYLCQKYSIMALKDFFSFSKNKFFWWNIIAMMVVVILLIWGVLKGLDLYTHHGEGVAVPDIKGMRVNEAQMMLRNHNLIGVVADSTYAENRPAGTILESNPPVGQLVKKKRIIYLTINSSSAPLVTVPDVVENSSLRQAEIQLTASGFKLDSVQYVSGEKDWVYAVKYKGQKLLLGEKVPMGANLVIVAGNGGENADSLSIEQPQIPDSLKTDTTSDESWF